MAVELWKTRRLDAADWLARAVAGEFSKSCEQAGRTAVCAHGLVTGRHFHSLANMLPSPSPFSIQAFDYPFALVKDSDRHRTKMQQPPALAKRLKTYALTDKCLADTYLAPAPFDPSRRFDLAGAPLIGIGAELG